MLFPGCSFCHTYPRLDAREAGNPETSIGTDKGKKKKACSLWSKDKETVKTDTFRK